MVSLIRRMIEYPLVFAAGLIGSFHCVGMCGGFPIAVTSFSTTKKTRIPKNQILYNSGRVFTYTFLGATAGYLGLSLREIEPFLGWQATISTVMGVLMVVVGLQILGILGEKTLPGFNLYYSFLKKAIASFIKQKGLGASFYLGLFNGFLPCPLIYAFLFKAAASGSPEKGATIMLSFGLGTIPAMFLIGIFGRIASLKLQGSISRASGFIVVMFGVFTIIRGFLPYFFKFGNTHLLH
jgi:sulfite exporter TauE/SafE